MNETEEIVGDFYADRIWIREIFEEHLMKGDGSVITDQNIATMNAIARLIYDTPVLDESGVDTLKYLIMVCNVLYNRTDIQVLPIEDGFYDLLLEKYKEYDKNFQVGAAVVEFDSFIKKDPNYKPTTCPIYKLPKHEPEDPLRNKVWQSIKMTDVPVTDQYTSHTTPIYMDFGDVSKRLHNTEHNHPDLVGTLDKCKFVTMADAAAVGADKDPNVKILERDFFQKHIDNGIINPNQEIDMILELKYDGISVEADCTNIVESARTRGDTGIGVASDITPTLYGYPFPRARCRIGERAIGVKFEAIMTKSDLQRYSIARGKTYANCRMAMIGLCTASDAYKYRDYITLVPLAIDKDDMPQLLTRDLEIRFMNEVFSSHSEPLRWTQITGTVTECLYMIKMYLEEASIARDYLNFMYDGIVVSYVDPTIREKLGRENYINKYSMAVKFDPLCKTTTFRGYTFEVGQGGQITPMIHYDPVEFLGTIHDKSTGSSLARFRDLGLRYGDHVDVTYRNDVMPYVTKTDDIHNQENTNPVIEPPTECPVCGHPLIPTESGKSLICPNWNCYGRKVARTVNMLAKLNLKGFGEQMIKQIDKYSMRDLVNLSIDYLAPRIGEGNAANFVALMNRLKTEPVYDYQLIGALGFNGIATKTWKIICGSIDFKDVIFGNGLDTFHSRACQLPGIGVTTVGTIMTELSMFMDDIKYIYSMPNVMEYYKAQKSDSIQIRFSGCRDSQLEEQLNKEGYDADSSSGVTKKTKILIIPYEGYTSTKVKKMPTDGIIVPIQEFRENPNKYLGGES